MRIGERDDVEPGAGIRDPLNCGRGRTWGQDSGEGEWRNDQYPNPNDQRGGEGVRGQGSGVRSQRRRREWGAGSDAVTAWAFAASKQ